MNKNILLKLKILALITVLLLTCKISTGFENTITNQSYQNEISSDWTVGVNVGDELVLNTTYCKGDCETRIGIGESYNFKIVDINSDTITYYRWFSKASFPIGNYTVPRSGYVSWGTDIMHPVTTTNLSLLKALFQSDTLSPRNITIVSESASQFVVHENYPEEGSAYDNYNFTYSKTSGWLIKLEVIVTIGGSFYTEVHLERIEEELTTSTTGPATGDFSTLTLSLVVFLTVSAVIQKKRKFK